MDGDEERQRWRKGVTELYEVGRREARRGRGEAMRRERRGMGKRQGGEMERKRENHH